MSKVEVSSEVLGLLLRWEKKPKDICAGCEEKLDHQLYHVTYTRPEDKSRNFKLCWVCAQLLKRPKAIEEKARMQRDD